MTAPISSKQVWQEIEKNLFAVLGFVTARNEARTAGIVYIVNDDKLYISTGRTSWKAKHIAQNPRVSLTIPIAKRIPFMPWMKIPAATITFSGEARLFNPDEVPQSLLQALYRGMETDPETLADTCIIEVTPERDFITYGVGVPLMTMRNPEQARGRVGVARN